MGSCRPSTKGSAELARIFLAVLKSELAERDPSLWWLQKWEDDMGHWTSRFGAVAGFIALGAVPLTSCQTASEVVQLSPGRYSVSSAACPACGGTRQAISLATAKAQEFCDARGQTLVTQNMESRNLNAVGAGASSMEFSCVPKVAETDVVACYDGAVRKVKELYGELGRQTLEKISGYSSFESLSDKGLPSEEQSRAINLIGSETQRCQQLQISVMPPERADVANTILNRQLVAMAELSGGSMTFGAFARRMTEIDAEEIAALRALNLSAAEERRWLEEQRLRSMQNLNTQIDRAFNR